jgi:hypothetical protein
MFWTVGWGVSANGEQCCLGCGPVMCDVAGLEGAQSGFGRDRVGNNGA